MHSVPADPGWTASPICSGLICGRHTAQSRPRCPDSCHLSLLPLRSKPPAGDNWLHEIKYDGYRLQIHLDKGRVTIRTRTGLDWTRRFSAIAAAFDIRVDRAIFDGEVVAVKFLLPRPLICAERGIRRPIEQVGF
jgi:hypothetical protein